MMEVAEQMQVDVHLIYDQVPLKACKILHVQSPVLGAKQDTKMSKSTSVCSRRLQSWKGQTCERLA